VAIRARAKHASKKSGLRSRAAARGPQANQVDGDGDAYEKPAPRIKQIVIHRDGLAEDPRHKPQNERDVGDLKQAAVFLVEATHQRMHLRISFLK
jgi:hypothetical protein